MTFRDLFLAAKVPTVGFIGEATVTGIRSDSRSVRPGDLFVCYPGLTRNSEEFLADAHQAGATAALVTTDEGFALAKGLGLSVAQVAPPDFADAAWRLCDAILDHPTRNLRVIGVTGTNGKTTTAWLLRDALAALGVPTGYLGTLGFMLPGHERELSNTTPFAVELFNLLAEARDAGVEALAMEVSSHALDGRRADGVEFDAAVFTNLTQDHLDYHGSMAAYESAKWRLFEDLPRQTEKAFRGAVNADDETGARWLSQDPNLISYGLGNGVTLRGIAHQVLVDQIEMELRCGDQVAGFVAPLGGSYNVSNLLSAAAGLWALNDASGLLGDPTGVLDRIAEGLSQVRPVPGRFEAVPNDHGIGILVDYAHTPDALEKLLDAVRPLTQGRVITVFGCGGDRDRTKRPRMALAASERSDLSVATSDNPRTEDPQAILDEVVAGIVPGREYVAIVDRREAIVHAVGLAKPGDVVVIAGKGHENYQIIGRTKFPMDDRDLARAGLEARP